MKKKNLKNLALQKKSISNLSSISKGGAEQSQRRTNCDYCAAPAPADPKPVACYTTGGHSCGIMCMLTDPNYSIRCSS